MGINETHAPGSLLKARTAAKLAGLSLTMFVASCSAGHIPCQILKLGQRQSAYVRAAQFNAWLQTPESKTSLFV